MADFGSTISIQDAVCHPRQLGCRIELPRPLHALDAHELELARSAVLRHGVVSFHTDMEPTAESFERCMQALGTLAVVPETFKTVSLSAHVNVVANVNLDGSPNPSGYRHSDFWHCDGQYLEPRPSAFCNMMMPVIVNPTRTLFLDVTIDDPRDSSRYRGLEQASIHLRREMDGRTVADVTKRVWQLHPVTKQIALLVPSMRDLPDEPLIGVSDPEFRLASDVRHDLATRPGRAYAHRYTRGEVLVWDNHQVLHRAEGPADAVREPRFIYRGHFELTPPKAAPARTKTKPKPRGDGTHHEVLILGAGASGLIVASELLDVGISDFRILESSEKIGGVYNGLYDGARLVSSNNITYFSTSNPDPEVSRFLTTEEYLEYLRRFADARGLAPHILFRHTVRRIRRNAGRRGWVVRTSDADGERVEMTCEHVVVCTGVHNTSNVLAPEVMGEPFSGTSIHAKQVTDLEIFRGKRVVIVGGGEMASDLALFSAQRSRKTFIAVRGMGRIVPRTLAGQPLDTSLSRAFHSINRRWDTAGPVQWRFRATRLLEKRGASGSAPVHDLLAEWNKRHSGELTAFSRYATKTDAMAQAVLEHGAEVKPNIVGVDGRWVIFADGSREQCDVLVSCTGFASDPSILPQGLREARIDELYLRMFHPAAGAEIAFVGFIRPEAGGIPPMAEMQARYLALVLAGRRGLPGRQQMAREVALQQARDLKQFPIDSCRYPALTDFFFYLEQLASLIGCRPSRLDLLEEPLALWSVMMGPVSGAQYRLCGPGARREESLRTLRRMAWSGLAPDVAFLMPLYIVSEAHRIVWLRSREVGQKADGYEVEVHWHGLPPRRREQAQRLVEQEFWGRSPIVARLKSHGDFGRQEQRTLQDLGSPFLTCLLLHRQRGEARVVGCVIANRVEYGASCSGAQGHLAHEIERVVQSVGLPWDDGALMDRRPRRLEPSSHFVVSRLCVARHHGGRGRALAMLSRLTCELDSHAAAQGMEAGICLIAQVATEPARRQFSRAGYQPYRALAFDDIVPWGNKADVRRAYEDGWGDKGGEHHQLIGMVRVVGRTIG